jgi:hypothetical protein
MVRIENIIHYPAVLRPTMKKTGIHFIIAVVALAALNLTFIPTARADRQSRADAIAILTSGTWHFKGKHFDISKVFDPNGKMTTPGGTGKDSTAKWKVDYKQVTISYSYYEEILLLPLDPKGTTGIDGWGDRFTATCTGAGGTPVATPTPVPTGLDALQGVTPSGPALTAIMNQLTAKKWHFAGTDWSDDRTFAADGTLKVANGKAAGAARWQIMGGQVVMIFADHRENMALPLDPKAAKGTDAFGHAFTAAQVEEANSTAGTPAPSSGGSYFGTTSESDDVPSPTPYPTPTPAGQ